MSYCRWSSDNFKSDVYVYESANGYVCHVASSRRIGHIPDLPNLMDDSDEYMKRLKEQFAILDSLPLEPIGGEFDGDTAVFDTPQEMVEYLEMLGRSGYHVPVYAIKRLKDEAEES